MLAITLSNIAIDGEYRNGLRYNKEVKKEKKIYESLLIVLGSAAFGLLISLLFVLVR